MRSIKLIFTGVVLIMALQGCASSGGWYHLPAAEFNEIDYGYVVKTATVRNIEMGYIDQGQGDVLLLIHGLGSNAKGWSRNIDALSQNHRVLAVDLPGYGHSDKGYYEYSLEFYAQVLKDFLSGLGVEKATYVGHSMGGQIALISALEYPETVQELVLISPAGFETFTDGEGDWMSRAVSAKFVSETTVRGVAINLKSNFYDAPSEADFMITDRIQVRGASDFDRYCYAVSLNVAGMIDAPVYDRLDEISHRALVLFGENDNLIPNRYLHGGETATVAVPGVAKLQNGELQMLPKCGHFVQFEKPEETNLAIEEFLSR